MTHRQQVHKEVCDLLDRLEDIAEIYGFIDDDDVAEQIDNLHENFDTGLRRCVQ